MVARLRYYFQRAFISPLFLGITLSIIFTTLIFINYSKNLSTNSTLLPIFRKMEDNINAPYIETVKSLLFKNFQPLINNLIFFKKFYLEMKEDNFIQDEKKREEFINKYSYNGLLVNKDYQIYVNKTLEDPTENPFLDRAVWIKNREMKNLNAFVDENESKNNMNKITKTQLFYSTNMIPLFRSIIENTGNQTKSTIKNIYLAYENTELFYFYPFENLKNQTDPYGFFGRSNYPTYCHSPYGDTLNFYYFKCQPWWQEVQIFKTQNNFDISITMPYIYATDFSQGITICIRFDDDLMIIENGEIKQKTSVVICIDSYLEEIKFTLDYFSKNINGYFFVMRLNSDVPIYYPFTNIGIGQTSVSNFEFAFNVTYYLNELNNFKDTSNDFFKYLKDEKDSTIFLKNNYKITGNFTKNNKLHNYVVNPVQLYLHEDEPNRVTHFFSIVLVTSDSSLNIGDRVSLVSKIVTLVTVLAFFGLILLLIGKYLINALADNIVRPLRSLKFIIQGMSNKQIIEEKDEKEMTKQEEEIDSKVAREDADISFERTKEIEIFGQMIIKLQNVLNFTTNNKNSQDSLAMLKYINSKYSFGEVSNLRGKNLCDSNVGNLALKCSKYDKAIYHLNLSLQKELRIMEQLEKNKIKMKNFAKNKSMVPEMNSLLTKNIRLTNSYNSLEAKKNKLLESRYPKLIYAYKKFYRNLTRVLKEKNTINKMYQQDFYVGDKHHSLENYEDTVKGYLEWARSTKDIRRIAEAILEYNEFMINYKVSLNQKNPDEVMMKNKETCIKSIIRNFYEFDSIFDRYKESNESSKNLKIIYDKIRSNKKNNFDLIEIPFEILMQKSNYLKGKFMKVNQDYRSALEFFYNSQKINVICCAKLVKMSIKQIINIYKIIIENISYDIDLIKNKNQVLITKINTNTSNFDKDREIERRLKNKEQFQTHIDEWNKKLCNFTYFNKDFSVLLNLSKSINHNPKKLDKAIKISDSIFENFITAEDRFSLFLVSKSANPLISLSYKNFQTFDFIKESIGQIKLLIDDIGIEKDGDSCLMKSIVKTRDYLNKRDYGNSEKWVLVITDDISEGEIEYFNPETIQRVFGAESKDHIAVIGIGMNQGSKELLTKNLNYNKNCYVDYDNLEKLKHNLRIKGSIFENQEFSNEIYESNENI